MANRARGYSWSVLVLMILLVFLALSVAACSVEINSGSDNNGPSDKDKAAENNFADAENAPTFVRQSEQTLEALPEVDPAPAGAMPAKRSTVASTLEEFVQYAAQQEVDPFWSEQFAGWAANDANNSTPEIEPYDPGTIAFFDQAIETGCGTVSLDTGSHYCEADKTVYFATPSETQDAESYGDFSFRFTVTHEWAHHVQAELGYFEYRDASVPGNFVWFENQADCLAGVWAHSAYGQSTIDDGDILEGIKATEGFGDARTVEEGKDHGSSDERKRWFLTGFESGAPASCGEPGGAPGTYAQQTEDSGPAQAQYDDEAGGQVGDSEGDAANETTEVAQDQYDEGDGDSGGDAVTSLANDLAGKQVDLASAGSGVPESSINTNSPSPEAVFEYLNFVVQNNDQFWTQFFLNNGFGEPLVSYKIVMPNEAWQSNCTTNEGPRMTVTHDTQNAFYCSEDEMTAGYSGTIYLPVTTMTKMWNGDIFGRPSQQQGDFAAAILTAHEFGHHVTDEMRQQYSRRDGVEYPEPSGKNNELIADCMAGVWTASTYYQGFLDGQADLNEAVDALYAIGDQGPPSEEGHGTPKEREEALSTGYFGIPGVTEPGHPYACIQKYWK